jgi:hypothetical protein
LSSHSSRYSAKSFAQRGLEIDGQVKGGERALRPDAPIRDVLVFERPAKTASRLRLQLPATAIGEEGSLKFEIPISMIAVEQDLKQGAGPGHTSRAAKPDESKIAQQQPGAPVGDDNGGPIPIPGVTSDERDERSEGDEPSGEPADAPNHQKNREKPRRREE